MTVAGLADQQAMEDEINRRLDAYKTSPDPLWDTITNTSIEGRRTNPVTGIRGDWIGTLFDAIYVACRCDEDAAGKIFGNLWKLMIIRRSGEDWIGYRSDPVTRPTFPTKGITLDGKT